MINRVIPFFLFILLNLFGVYAQASTGISFVRKCDVQTIKGEHIVGWEVGGTWDTCNPKSRDITKSASLDDDGKPRNLDNENIKLYQHLYTDLDYGHSSNNRGFLEPYMKFAAVTLEKDYKQFSIQEVKKSVCDRCININKAPILSVTEDELSLLKKSAYASFAIYTDFHVVVHLISYNPQYKTSKDLEDLFLQLISKHSPKNKKINIDIYGNLEDSSDIDFVAIKNDMPQNTLFFEYGVAD